MFFFFLISVLNSPFFYPFLSKFFLSSFCFPSLKQISDFFYLHHFLSAPLSTNPNFNFFFVVFAFLLDHCIEYIRREYYYTIWFRYACYLRNNCSWSIERRGLVKAINYTDGHDVTSRDEMAISETYPGQASRWSL